MQVTTAWVVYECPECQERAHLGVATATASATRGGSQAARNGVAACLTAQHARRWARVAAVDQGTGLSFQSACLGVPKLAYRRRPFERGLEGRGECLPRAGGGGWWHSNRP